MLHVFIKLIFINPAFCRKHCPDQQFLSLRGTVYCAYILYRLINKKTGIFSFLGGTKDFTELLLANTKRIGISRNNGFLN